MFNLIKQISYNIEKKQKKIKLGLIKNGINSFDDFIIKKEKNNIVVYDRNCDHQGGKIISKNGIHECPMHNWIFDPVKGLYNNGAKKEKKKFTIKDENILIDISTKIPCISKRTDEKTKTKIRFFNHAFVKVSGKDFSFATDPWAIGPAFNTGWWLKFRTKNDWIKELNNCSFIYISHNHPDHLHPLTLRKIRKDLNFIVPNFRTDSTGKYLEELGFKNIFRLKFGYEYRFKQTNLILSILKSGDFREDSGLFFSNGEFSSLFDVDSNSLNFNMFPKATLYASSFAGGATGYPIMFENFNAKEKIDILKKNKQFLKTKKLYAFKKIKPKYFLPYAGFFIEKLKRDINVFRLQNKNKISDYNQICKKNKIEILNVEKQDEFYFEGQKIINSKKNKSKEFKDLHPSIYLKNYKENYKKIDTNFIKNYFENSFFKDNLIVYLSLVDDDFKKSFINFKIDFSKQKPYFSIIKNFSGKLKNNILQKQLYLKCRIESFLNTVYNKNPWEDLSIGFQCKVVRNPNEYNYKFWHHFSNTYITSKNVRYSSECNSCDKLNHIIDNAIYSKNN